MRLTESICRARAACLMEAAEHLHVAWSEQADECLQIDWAYRLIYRIVDKWERRAERFTSAKACEQGK